MWITALFFFFIAGFFLFSDTHHYCQLLLPFDHFAQSCSSILTNKTMEGWSGTCSSNTKVFQLLKTFKRDVKNGSARQSSLWVFASFCPIPFFLLSPGEWDRCGCAYTLFPSWQSICREAILTRFPVLQTSGSHRARQWPSHKLLLRCVKILAKTNINTNILAANSSPFFLLKWIKIQINLLKPTFSNDFFSSMLLSSCWPGCNTAATYLLCMSWHKLNEDFWSV